MKKCILFSFFIMLVVAHKLSAAVVYVNGSYTGSIQDGTSWATPYKDILVAINNASAGDQLWIAKGTYQTPTRGSLQGFHIKKDVTLYGGFAGNETSVYSRDLEANATLLSSSIGDRIFSLNGNIHLEVDGFSFSNFTNAMIEHYDTLTSNADIAYGEKFYLKINNCKFQSGSRPMKFGYYIDLEISNTSFDGTGMSQMYFDHALVTPNDETQISNFKFSNITVFNYPSPFIVSDRYSVDAVNSTFYNNNFSYDLFVCQSPAMEFKFTNCTLRNSQCRLSGTGPTLTTYDGCVYKDNNVQTPLVLSNDATNKVVIKNCQFLNNNLTASSPAPLLVFSENPTGARNNCTIENTVFDGNKGTLIFNSASDVQLINVSFLNNNITPGAGSGRMIQITPTSSVDVSKNTIDMQGVRFENNTATNSGAVLFFTDCKYLSIKNSIFKNTTAVDGSIRLIANQMKMENCTFTNIKATQNSAIEMHNDTNPIAGGYIKNCIFDGNEGNGTGCLRITMGLASFSSCSFLNGKATIGGALSYLGNGSLSLSDCLFENNTASDGGGAIGNWTNVIIDRCKFKNNKCLNFGGGALYATYGIFYVYNSLFEGNSSLGRSGGAVFMPTGYGMGAPAMSEFRNCTFVKNTSINQPYELNESEVISGQPVVVANCIFWNNGTKSPLGSYYPSGVVTYSDVQGGYPGEGNVDLDPKFVDFDGGNYRLSCASPLLNVGKNDLSNGTTDLDNAVRIFAGTVEMGAYEFPQDPATASAPPVAAFNVNASACKDEQLSFVNGTTPMNGVRFEWNFGDGTISQLTNPFHAYTVAGTYTVTLRATNSCGASASISHTVNVTNVNSPTISYVTLVCPGQSSTFTTNSTCPSLVWSVEGGTIQGPNGTNSISVLWGDGSTGNGKVTLLATGCGTGLCETPVSISIPIVPVNFQLQGPNKLCRGAVGTYETTVKDITPSTIYTWIAKAGTINGTASGYNLNKVDVRWSTTDTMGVIYLTTYNELLRCGRTDSIRVKLRPTFDVTGTNKVCEGQSVNYSINVGQLTDYNWSVTGSNSISSTGSVTWGNTNGTYQVVAEVINPDQACNAKDTLNVELFLQPVISSVSGVTEVTQNSSQSYVVSSTPASDVQYVWTATGGSVGSSFANNTTVYWGAGPYQLSVIAKLSNGVCTSNPYVLDIAADFVYTVSGPDTVCIGTSAVFTANNDPGSSNFYTWSSNFTNAFPAGDSYQVTCDKEGTQSINLKVVRNGKEYNVYKNVYVKAANTDIAITGRQDIDPQGTGTYVYSVRNSLNLSYNYTVVGAANTVRNGNDLTITWGGSAPFSINVVGIVPGNTCTGVPAVMTINKAPVLSTQISSQGAPCVNSRVKYFYITDNLATNLSWTVSNGGTIISNSGNEIIVEWASVGLHTVGFSYERFGTQTYSLNVDVKALPTPVISDAKVCGSNPLNLSTTTPYVAYKWFAEPNTVAFSTLAQPPVSAEAQYRVEVTDANGCIAFANKYIEQTPLPKVKIFSDQDFGYCQQTPGATVPVTMKTYEGQDYHYQWFANGSPVGIDNAVLNTSVATSTLSAVNYTVKVTLETCSQTSAPSLLTVYPCGGGGGVTCTADPVSFTVGSNNGCPPYTFTNQSANIQPTDVFGWTFGDGSSSNLATPPQKVYNEVGIYNVYLSRGCQLAASKITVPGLALFKVDAPGCKGQSLTFNELSVNVPGYPIVGWEWDFGDGALTGRLSGSGSRDASHLFVNSGTYVVKLTVYVKISATQECASTFQKEISVTAPPVADFTVSPPPCTDNTYKFIDNSTFLYSTAKYLWNFGNGNGSTLKDPSQKLAAGTQTISLEVTDLLGCKGTVSKSQLVLVPNEVGKIVITGDTILCNGRTVTLTSPTGSTYVWKKNGVILPNTTQSITVSAPGSYVVDYSVPGCVVTTLAVVLKNYAVPNLLSGNQKVCVGDQLVVNTNLDPVKYSFTWKFNTADITDKGAQLIVNNAQLANAGNYTVSVTDSKNGCVLSLPDYAINVYNKPVKPVLSASQLQSCYDGTVTLNSGVNPTGYSFAWYKGAQLITSETNPSIALTHIVNADNYSLKLTDDNSGCSITTDNQFISVAPKIILNVTGDKLACEYSNISFGTPLNSTDYNFQWYKDGVASGPNNTKYSFASVLLSDAGSYYTVATSKGTTNLMGCQATSDTLVLVVKPGPVKPVISGPAAFCTGSPITLTSNLTNNFQWNTGATTSSIPVSIGGTYTVTSTNPLSGCSISASQAVVQNPLPDLSFFPTGIYERCASDRVSFSGLDAYSNYAWYVNGSLFSTSNKMYPTKSGKYTLSVTSDKGCVANSDTLRFTSLKCPCYVTNTNNDGIGSLREAIECSNSKYGRDYIDFAITGVGPFVIKPTTPLPELTDSVVIEGFTQSGVGNYAIILDGSLIGNGLVVGANLMYNDISGLTFRNCTNALRIRDGVSLSSIDSNVFVSNKKSAIEFNSGTHHNTVTENSISSSGTAVVFTNGSHDNLLQNNIITNSEVGVGIYTSSAYNKITNNEILDHTQYGIWLNTKAAHNDVVGNTILGSSLDGVYINNSRNNKIDTNFIGVRQNGVVSANLGNGVRLNGTADSNTVQRNLIGMNGQHGVLVTSGNRNKFSNNYIGITNSGNPIGNQRSGIYSAADTLTITSNRVAHNGEYGLVVQNNTTILSNTLKDNISGGAYVVGKENRISKTLFTNVNTTVDAIDLHSVGNLNKQPGVFKKYRRSVTGSLLLKGTALAGDSVEVFVNNNTVEQALKYIGVVVADAAGVFEIDIPVGPYFDPNQKNYYVNTASNATGNTSQLSQPFMVGCFNCVCIVSNTNDAGPGSLRGEVNNANTGGCLTINFAITPDTINILSPISDIVVPLTINGIQGGVDPLIFVKGNGSFNAISVSSDGVDINNLGFTNFKNALTVNGDYSLFTKLNVVKSVRPVKFAGNNNALTASAINTYSSKSSTFATDTLVVVTGNNNEIGRSGEGNRLIHATQSGIVVSGGINNRILYNEIFDNTIAISHALNGNNLQPVPYNMVGSTLSGVSSVTGKAKPNDRVQLFISKYYAEQANTYAAEVMADGSGNWTAIIPSSLIVPNQNNYVVATATDPAGNTSPLSPPVRIGTFVQVCYVTNTLDAGVGSLREAVNCVNLAGMGMGVPARIEFQLPSTPNTIVIGSGLIVTNNYGVKINPFGIPVSIKAPSPSFAGFTWATNGFEIKNLTFDNFATALYCQGSNAVIDSNEFVNDIIGIAVNAPGNGVAETITHNFFANDGGAIVSQQGSLTIQHNTIGQKKNGTAGVLSEFGVSISNAASVDVSNNTITQIGTGVNPLTPAAYKGVPLYIASANGAVINNTIQGTGTNLSAMHLVQFTSSSVNSNHIAKAQTGVLIENSLSTQFMQNDLKEVTAIGFDAIKSNAILFMQNTVEGLLVNGKPIELHLGTANSSNNDKPTPDFISATFHDGKLFLIGESEALDYIELFYSDLNGRDLVQYTLNTTADSAGVWIFQLPIAAVDAKNYYFRATARNTSDRRTSEASAVFNPDLKICLVTTTADNTPGSLREAITKANANTCNIIQFNIAPGGFSSIQPVSDLPLITTAQLIIDATSQPGYIKGSPTVQLLNNTSSPYGFSTRGTAQFNVYGINVKGYDTSISITNAKIVELNDNVLTDFSEAGIGMTSTVFKYGNLNTNKITSAGKSGMRLVGINNVTINSNKIYDVSDFGIYTEGVNQKILSNIVRAGNTTTAVGIALKNGSDAYLFKDTILNAHRGITIVQGQNHRITSNGIGSLSPANVASGYKVEEYGIFLDQTKKTKVFRNEINGSQKGVFVQNSLNPTVQNTKSKKIADRVINIVDCDSAIVNFNTLDSLKTGIYISNSQHSYIQANNMSHITDYGIYLDNGADYSLLHGNNIGAEYVGDTSHSEGEGLHIKSSYNVVGRFNSEDSVNTFFHNKKGGIVVDGGMDNLITYNIFFENDISLGRPTAYAISLKNGGNNSKPQPVITNHEYISGKLHLYGSGSVVNDSVHVYLGDGGYEEARVFMGSALATGTTWEVVIDTTGKVKPQSTLYLVATATNPNHNTSPLSKMYILGDCYVTSLKDTTDNEYPMPNSLRMAVNCANGQKAHVGIYYKVDKYGEKDVELQMKLQPIQNTYGVSFNARNLVTDRLLGGIDGTKLPALDDTAWVISKLQGPSTFDSLHVDHCKNGILVMADSISVRGFAFENNIGDALSARTDADSLIVSGCSFKGAEVSPVVSRGIVLESGLKHATLAQNSFGTVEAAIKANGNDSLVIKNNLFGQVAADTLAFFRGIDIRLSKAASLENNTFIAIGGSGKAIFWDQSTGNIDSNTVACRRSQTPVDINNSFGVGVHKNRFIDTSIIYMMLTFVHGAEVTDNTFQRADYFAVQVNNSGRVQIKNNTVSAVEKDAFDVTYSDSVLISRNTVTHVHYDKRVSPIDSGLCIKIYKGLPEAGNNSKQEPTHLTYAIKKGADNRTGLFIQGTAEANDSIEVFFSDSLSASMNKYIVTGKADINGLWEVRVPRKYYYRDTTTWYHVVAVAIKADSNTSQTSSVLHIPPVFSVFYVRNDYDSGANSLRDAMQQVNASDLYARVIFQIDFPEFQPGPYHIKLDSLIDPIYSYMGYLKDGNSQLGKGAGGDQRIIVESAKIDTAYVFDIVDSSDVCEIKNIWFNDARLGVRIANNKNKVENFHFITSGTLPRRDTAFVVTGQENEIKSLEIHDYNAGILLTEGAGKNKISKSRIDNVGIAVIASDSAYKNIVNKSLIYNTSEVAFLTDSAAADNVFTNNSLGKDGMPIMGCAVKVNNSPGQTFTYNRISVMTPYTDGRLSSAVVVTGTSSNNYFFGNKIGVDSLSQTVYPADMRGFSIVPSVDGSPNHTTVIGNEIAGTNWVSIFAESSTEDLFGDNLIGTDSLREIHSIDSTAIYFKNCTLMEASDNTIYGYKVYGIELNLSDNVRMNRNVIHSTFTNNKAININAGTPQESNGGLVIPEITQGILIDTQTVRLSGTSKPGIAVEVYESVKDTIQSTAYVNKVITQTDATGTWTIDVPRRFFSFAKENCFVAQNHEGARSSEFSNSYRVLPLLCQLAASNPPIQILDPLYKPCPGPAFVLDPGLDDGLHYNWTSDAWNTPYHTRKVSMTESAPNIVMTVTDDFGCSLTRNTDVEFKQRPINPDFIVSSEVYAGDTIMLVDVSLPVPTEYTWISSAGVKVLSEGSTSVLVGEDGNTYPAGTRFIEFILPDSGGYNITQKSLRDGCKVELSKDLTAKPKNPNDDHPYFVAPEIQSLSAYPNPSTGSGVIATVKAGSKDPATLSLVTNDGSMLWSVELSGKTTYKVTLPDIEAAGVYHLKWETASKKIVFKLIVN